MMKVMRQSLCETENFNVDTHEKLHYQLRPTIREDVEGNPADIVAK